MTAKSHVILSIALFLSAWAPSTKSVGLYADGSNFCYDDNDSECEGPSFWSGHCNEKSSQSQSPILLPRYLSYSRVPRGINLTLDNYVANGFTLQNNGHTVVAKFAAGTNGPPIGLGRREGFDYSEYKLDSAHLHWGPSDDVGSEHCFETKGCFAMELHLVHYKSTFGSVSDAINSQDPNSLAVIGVMLQATAYGGEGSTALAPIIENLSKVEKPSHGEVVNVDGTLDYRPFLKERGNLYTYKGSLTTPTCDEKVSWYVLDKTFGISREDVKKFRELYDEQGNKMTQNYRPLQERNRRGVYLAGVTSS